MASHWLSRIFHGHLPSYRQVKTSIALNSAIFDRMGKNDVSFRQLRHVSTSILPASNQTQRWNSAVRSHLFEWIIACISFNYRSRERKRERERERERWQLCVLYLLAVVSVHQLKQLINMERWLNGLGTTCALNGFTAYLPANQNPVFRQTME